MAASIMLAGFAGHVSLPPMYAEMREPKKFKPTLYASFALMLGIYTIVGVCGYILYGRGASLLITQDMSDGVSDASPTARLLVNGVLVLMLFKLFTGSPMCVLTLCDIVQNLYHEQKGVELSERASMWTRVGIWAICAAASIAAYDYLKYVTALIGVNSLVISVLAPIGFYIQLHWHRLTAVAKIAYVSLLLLSALVTVLFSAMDIQDFVAALNAKNS
jgi:amino acid permease